MNWMPTFQSQSGDRIALAIGGVVTALLATLPFLTTNQFLIGMVFSILLFITLASSWNILSGYSGYISFGHVAFFGIGGYTCAILLVETGTNIILSVLLGGLFTTVVALPVAVATIRLDDVYFSIIMLAMAALTREIAVNLDITGGPQGLILTTDYNLIITFEYMLAATVVTILTSYFISRTYFGLALTAIHDDEEAAGSLGLHATKYKLSAFALSAVYPGIVGGIAATYWLYINPDTMFSTVISGDMMIMSVLGGMGTVLGPIIGATVLTVVRSETQASYPFIHGIVFGLLFMVLVLAMPNGVMSVIQDSDRLTRFKDRIQKAGFRSGGQTDD